MKKDIFNLSGKKIVLTGGLGLLGLNFVEAFLERGATVIIIDMVDEITAKQKIQSKLGDAGEKLLYFHGDVTDRKSLEEIKEKIMTSFGNVDALINNAAMNPKVEAGSTTISQKNTFEDLKIEDWERELKVNLTGAMLCSQVFGGVMKTGSTIINISSVYGFVGPDQSIYPEGFIKPATYGVSKGALVSLTKYLAAYWGKKDIRVNCLVLGGVENSQDKDFIKKYSGRTQLARMARADEYNGAIVFLVSDASSYMTGSNLIIDGGWTAW